MGRHKQKTRKLASAAAEMKQREELAAREREKSATTIVRVMYEAGRDAIVVDLSTGVTLVVPRRLILDFAAQPPESIADVEKYSTSEDVWSEAAEGGAALHELVRIAAGDDLILTLGDDIAGYQRWPITKTVSRKARLRAAERPWK